MAGKALIVVDMQNDYFPGGRFSLEGVEAAAANAARLIEASRARGDLVVHVRHEFAGDNPPFFAPGSEGAAIHESVRNRGDEPVILKNHINSFRDTPLKTILDGGNVTEVTIAGAMSHMCVDGITRAAVDYGYRATVVHDAVATRELSFNGVTVPARQVHAAFMAALDFGYASLISTDDYLAGAGRAAAEASR